jgi:hypothetical protein
VFFSYNKKHTSEKTGNKPKTETTITDLFIHFHMNKTGKRNHKTIKLKKRRNKNKHSALLVIYSASPSLFSS